ncbi:MAG TPA: ATP-binding cassette domain-containing protein [Streptosporangiaceae bacterium]|nr:ATP-binding cassette domain-containing protein [Streptosporangiaceae bacterium]
MSQSKTVPAVEAVGVAKNFGSVIALGGVDLMIPAGTITALLGPNGAGKTTLVRIIATLTKPDRGQVRVLGIDVVQAPAKVRARVGLTGQYVGLDDALNGRDNLMLIGRLAGLDRRAARTRAVELAELLGVADALDRAVRTYSGGMRRRLDLAASLMTRPPLLVLDEPTTGLDPASRQQLWEALAGLRADGTTMLLTTQYLEEADRFADAVHVLSHGKIIASGTASQLKDKVADRVVQIRLGRPVDAAAAVGLLTSGLSLAEGQIQVEAGSGQLTFAAGTGNTAEDGADALLKAAATLRSAGIAIADLSVRQPSLDEAFLALTGGEAGPGSEPPAGVQAAQAAGVQS